MSNPRFLFYFIIILTIVAVITIFPKEFRIDIGNFHKTVYGIKPDFFIGPLRIHKDLSFQKGLDLEGGVSVTYKADTAKIPSYQQQDAVDSAKTVIQRRIDYLGVREPLIQTAKVNNEYRIIVEIPGISDVNQAINLIGKTAQLTFWEEGASGSAKLNSETLPLGVTQIFQNPKQTNLSGSDLARSTVTFDPNTGEPQVQLTFSSEGAKKFADITKRNVSKPVAIVLDNQVIQAPTVQTVIADGNAVITGGFTTEQAKALSIQLNAGALPIPLSILEQHTVGATLGEASLQNSLFAAILGFVIIIFFMGILYGRLGIIASFALFLYTLYVLALFKLIPVTLTLAGIAGFILSIGMAVDANILIFERMREELRRGKQRNVAIELGFTRAWTSIRDSNISSLITSAILYYFGTGIVRGFAVTLAIGVLVSMFSAIIVTRTFLRLIYKEN
ncbi:MAG: protein translocase subunit SecD [Candidatus Levybacteria bacterium]|nr:protein translocase subunit SecD [Candidatus Levybacteria bacterium]